MTTQVQELDGSLSDFMSSVRQAFAQQFPPRRSAQGMVADEFWIRDIFESSVIVHDEAAGQMYRVPFMKSADGIKFEARAKWEKVKLTYAKEMIGDSLITEFAGKPPDVPTRPGVNVAELTEGDDNPFFLTLEISQVGRVSKNGLLHDDELANTLVSQINASAAEGIMGHIKEQERSTAYPVSDVHWLGAVRQGTSVWAKGYVPKTATAQREHFRILKATNGRAATSITGPAVREFVDKQKGVWRAAGFQLEQLDLAPYTRAALPPEAGFTITREMAYAPDAQEGAQEMDRNQIIAELTVADIPTAVREQIVRDATAGLVAENETLKTAVAEFRHREFERALDAKIAELVNWAVSGDEATKKVNNFKAMLRRQIVAQLADNPQAERIAEVAQAVWSELEPIAEAVRDALAGPPAVVAGRGRAADVRKLDTSPEAVERIRGKWGV